MIPHVLYLYWGGKSLSWLRYMTVASFKENNPDWTIKVYYPAKPTVGTNWGTPEHKVAYTGKDWFPELEKHAEMRSLDMTDIGFRNDMTEVHKSGAFRAWALHEFGGVYSDMDILYCKAMPAIEGRMFFRHSLGHYADGFLAAHPKDELFARVLDACHTLAPNHYQSYGPTLWNNLFHATPEGLNMPKEWVYAVDWQDADKPFTTDYKLPEEAIGLHWFGGSKVAEEWENKLTVSDYGHGTTIADMLEGLACSRL